MVFKSIQLTELMIPSACLDRSSQTGARASKVRPLKPAKNLLVITHLKGFLFSFKSIVGHHESFQHRPAFSLRETRGLTDRARITLVTPCTVIVQDPLSCSLVAPQTAQHHLVLDPFGSHLAHEIPHEVVLRHRKALHTNGHDTHKAPLVPRCPITSLAQPTRVHLLKCGLVHLTGSVGLNVAHEAQKRIGSPTWHAWQSVQIVTILPTEHILMHLQTKGDPSPARFHSALTSLPSPFPAFERGLVHYETALARKPVNSTLNIQIDIPVLRLFFKQTCNCLEVKKPAPLCKQIQEKGSWSSGPPPRILPPPHTPLWLRKVEALKDLGRCANPREPSRHHARLPQTCRKASLLSW